MKISNSVNLLHNFIQFFTGAIGRYFSPSSGTTLKKRQEKLLHIYLSALSVEAFSILAIVQYTADQQWLFFNNFGYFGVEDDLIGVIRILRDKYANDLENIQNAQFGGQDQQNDIQLIIEQTLVVESSHYSKSQIFVQKFNFDKPPSFSQVFHPNFFDNFSREIKVVNS